MLKPLTLLPFFLLSFFALNSLQACTCGGPLNYIFCQNVDTSYHRVSLIVITDSISYSLRSISIIENIHGGEPRDSGTLLGEDGLNCGQYLGSFDIGDTLVIAYYPESFGDSTQIYLSGCGTFYMTYENGMLNGGILRYDDFVASPYECLNQIDTEVDELLIEKNAIQLYPNPATSQLNVKTIEGVTIESFQLYGADGQCYTSASLSGNVLEIASLPVGVYMLRMNTNKGLVTRRFVKSL